MTSASELFHSRRSRTGRRTEPELGFNRLLADRDQHQLRHSLLRRRRRLGRREDRESSRQHQAFSLQEPEAGSSNNRNVADSGTSSIITNGAVVSERINRLMLTRNDRLPSFVLQARARVLERLRGSSSRLVEAASSSEPSRNLHGSGRQSLNIGPPRNLHGSGRQSPSSSLQEQSQVEISSITSLSELREAMASSSIYWEDFTSLDEEFVFESPFHFFDSDSGPEPELSMQNYTRMFPGLSLESIQSLPLEVFKDAEDGDRGVLLECCICLERFSNGDALLRLPCAHRFHVACLKPWLRTCGGCPYCRARI